MLRKDVLDLGQPVAPRAQVGVQLRTPQLRRLLPIVLACQDAVLIYSAFIFAYWARYGLELGARVHDSIAFTGYQSVAVLLLGIMIPTLLARGAYRTSLSMDIVDEAKAIFGAATVSIASVIVITYMLHEVSYSRGVMLYSWISVILFLIFGRALFRSFRGLCHQKGWGVRRLLVVGASDAGKMIMQSVMNRPDLGYEVVGFVEHRDELHMRDFGRFRALGTVADIPGVVDDHQVDEIIVALPASAHEEVWSILSLCERRAVGVKLVPDLFEMSLSRVQVDDIEGLPLLDVQEKPMRLVARAAKRGMDIVVGSMVVLLSLPIVGILALLVRLDSKGPAFIKQERVGHNGRRFTCFKLRTMRTDADQLLPQLQALNETDGPIFKMRNDPRCTRVGRYIRRFSLDELPQVWNVVLGHMSLVGRRGTKFEGERHWSSPSSP